MRAEKPARFEIIDAPIETLLSPEEAAKWIGVIIPFGLAVSPVAVNGKYYADADAAVRELARTEPELALKVARLYEERFGPLGSQWFTFEATVCRIISQG